MPHPRIEHVIVLMMENRSFDHMFGFMSHLGIDGLTGNETNPDAQNVPIRVSATAGLESVGDPGHRHFSVMFTLTGRQPQGTPPHYTPPYHVNNSGFVRDYAKKTKGNGHTIMQCQPETNIPVLATLARQFAVCDRWFASVPGATWPNRLFLHSGTSGGTSSNELSLYNMPTVFEKLSKSGRTWGIFHHGDSQALAFPKLWDKPWKRTNFNRMPEFFRRVRENRLPHYSFIEPNQLGEGSNSQHPSRNKLNSRGVDFRAGERLMADIYTALTENREVWEKSLFVITYDEHGGFYDHVAPPATVPPDATIGRERFGFDLLGVRVPAVIVSPYIAAGTIDHTLYDHTSVIATLREQFGIAKPLTRRDARANTFLHNLTLAEPRGDDHIPHFAPDVALESLEAADPTLEERPEDDELDMVWLMQQVDRMLADERAMTLEGIGDRVPESVVKPATLSFETKREAGEYADDVMDRFEESQESIPAPDEDDREW